MVHNAKARRGLDMRWQASCSCGWRGPLQGTQTAADRDAAAHNASENDGDKRPAWATRD